MIIINIFFDLLLNYQLIIRNILEYFFFFYLERTKIMNTFFVYELKLWPLVDFKCQASQSITLFFHSYSFVAFIFFFRIDRELSLGNSRDENFPRIRSYGVYRFVCVSINNIEIHQSLLFDDWKLH